MDITNSNLCIIPARGGSKRIPRKNIKDFLGKPIIAYSIEAAKSSGLFADVLVSTEDVEIASIAKQYGASVPFLRSEKTSNDFATTLEVLQEVVENCIELGIQIENICCLYATAPFVSSLVLQKSYWEFIERKLDSLLPVIPYSFPIQRSLILEREKVQFNYPEYKNTRSQDLRTCYHDAGQFYWMKKELTTLNSLITANTGAYLLSEIEAQDIDNEIDWKIAELKYKVINDGLAESL